MPKIVDPGARRRAVAAAVLRVVGRDGLEAASLRNVADEAGLAVGSVRHYFSDHDELVIFAMGELVGRIEHRLRARADLVLATAPGSDLRTRAEELLAELLPLDDERRVEAELWIAFTTAARTRPGLRPRAVELQQGTVALLARVLQGGQESGGLPDGLDVELESLRLAALVDGLTLQAVLEPDRLTPELLRRMLSHHLDTLGQRR
ncbi:TetR family transcriptional regulator C-terminal domain-containing protein [Streptomyces sp. NPDC051162]|uniref:TetR/AcrR family transcriptional regulator n=1 Tax=unclassified Streptomyces TaxID=2593676 RepID=UPI00341927FB